MKYLILIGTFLIVSCSTFKPRYASGTVTDLSTLLDSIQISDNIVIVDSSKWIHTDLITNKGVLQSKLFYITKDKRQYILDILKDSTTYHYKYRVE